MLLRANGRPLSGPLDWEGVLLDLRAGNGLELSVQGQSRTIEMEAMQFPSSIAARVTLFQDIELITVSSQIQGELGLSSESGALIADISTELTSRTRLQMGDVIIQMNRTRIRSAEDAASFFDELTGQQGRIVVYLERDNSYYTTSLSWRG
tara:strand:- start:249 stop:701 length:453 start_codon:yes stop_codon:yes gene_type:complete